MTPKPEKNNLSIRLAESVVFLRGSADSTMNGRRAQRETPPAMLRGLLTINLLKPMKISSIEIELVGKTRTAWPEGAGARRIEVTEEHIILSASTVFFRASETQSPPRRTASVGPGVQFDGEEESSVGDDWSDQQVPWITNGRSGSPDSYRRSSVVPPRQTRHLSVDQATLQRDIVSHTMSEGPATIPTHYEPFSPPHTPLHTIFARDHPSASLPDPPPPPPPLNRASSYNVSDANPGHQLEEFRNALKSDLQAVPAPHPPLIPEHSEPQSSSSSTYSYRRDSPRRLSIGEDRERRTTPASSRSPSRLRQALDHVHTPTGTETPTSSHSHGIASPTGSIPNLVSDEHHSESRTRGRRASGFSLAAVTGVVMDAVKIRWRSNSPSSLRSTEGVSHIGGPHIRRRLSSDFAEAHRGRAVERDRPRDADNGEGHEPGAKAQKALDKDATSGHGWKEFRKGTYTYPISFVIPPTAPPTLHCDGGSVTYRLKATVHRPGPFTAKLTSSREVLLVACPGEDDTEESENIIVQRQWESQLHYLLVISGKAFPIGATIPVHFTFVPMAKVKIYRISVLLEERVDYFTQFKRVARSDLLRRFELLSLRHSEKDSPPLLPLNDAEDYAKSPLRGYIDAADDNEAVSSIMGPGPWVLHGELQLPKSCNRLHFTNNHKKSNIRIVHVLKIILRVERGDDFAVDPKTGKRRLYDIVVQSPIHILSCRCKAEWTSLPRYSLFASEQQQAPMQSCLCHTKLPEPEVILPPVDASELPRPPPISGARAGKAPAPAIGTGRTRFPTFPHSANGSRISLDSQPDMDSLYNRNRQFARLVSGQESEFGEAPPKYDEVGILD